MGIASPDSNRGFACKKGRDSTRNGYVSRLLQGNKLRPLMMQPPHLSGPTAHLQGADITENNISWLGGSRAFNLRTG